MESKSGQIERTLTPDHTHPPLKTEARLEDGTGNGQQPQGFADFRSAFRISRLQPSRHSAGLQCIFTIPDQNVFLIIAYGNLPRA